MQSRGVLCVFRLNVRKRVSSINFQTLNYLSTSQSSFQNFKKARSNLKELLKMKKTPETDSVKIKVGSSSRAKVKTFQPRGTKKLMKKESLSSIVKPVPFKPDVPVTREDREAAQELAGHLDREEVLSIVLKFARKQEIKDLAAENNIDATLYQQVINSFKKYCADVKNLPTELYILLSDMKSGSEHIDSLFPYFLEHAKEVFPHITCLEDLEKVSDLRYPEARSIERKIVFHAGPTNSGKTYHALQRFNEAESGLYCAPLKLLASEVSKKCNDVGVQCDLITGDEKRYVVSEEDPSSHTACTIEMASTQKKYEVAVIDEIQMLRDVQRGWAWTRALLGLNADEIHVCGEDSAIELVKDLMLDTGENVEVRRYERLTPLTYLDTPIKSVENVKKGDCIVCFNKMSIYRISRSLEKRGMQCAVIYGHLPPGTKLEQARKFNDPDDPCAVMVATDAIGMGLNLCIKRVIFHSMHKAMQNEAGEKEMKTITTSQALQIAGRAGRKGTEYENGEVTAFRQRDLETLLEIKDQPVEPINRAGLFPDFDQIELFAYHLPHATLSNLLSIFETICKLDSNKFFMCQQDNIKILAGMMEHISLPLKMRYNFCLAPLSKQDPFICTTLVKFARRASENEPIGFNWLCRQIGWPIKPPQNLTELYHLEMVYDCLDLYLWLSYKYPDLFPDVTQVRNLQETLDGMICQGVAHITALAQNTRRIDPDDDDLVKTDKVREIVSEVIEKEIDDDNGDELADHENGDLDNDISEDNGGKSLHDLNDDDEELDEGSEEELSDEDESDNLKLNKEMDNEDLSETSEDSDKSSDEEYSDDEEDKYVKDKHDDGVFFDFLKTKREQKVEQKTPKLKIFDTNTSNSRSRLDETFTPRFGRSLNGTSSKAKTSKDKISVNVDTIFTNIIEEGEKQESEINFEDEY